MKKAFLAAAAMLAWCGAGNAATIQDFGINPTSAQGTFQHSLGALSGFFDDQYTFQLVGGPQFITIASVTNVFPSATDFITNFTGAVYDTVDGIIGNGNDVAVIGPALAIPCTLVPNCQGFAGSALLNAGSYYADFSGIAGGTSGYGGNVATFAVPSPLAGAGVPGLLAAFGMLWVGWKRRRGVNPS